MSQPLSPAPKGRFRRFDLGALLDQQHFIQEEARAMREYAAAARAATLKMREDNRRRVLRAQAWVGGE
ncbi:MAG: hypothetical protein LC792_06495 [Actinobacteria bacterium]|nr:hypothetical protein [Actinomycetota bacterium]